MRCVPEDRVRDRSGGHENAQLSRKDNNMTKADERAMERRKQILVAWGQLAPTATLGGNTLEQFTEATKGPVEVRERIDQARAGLRGLFQERLQADMRLRDQIAELVDAVKADPGFGANSPLYGAFGYVPRNARRSGLSRTKATTQTTGSANAA